MKSQVLQKGNSSIVEVRSLKVKVKQRKGEWEKEQYKSQLSTYLLFKMTEKLRDSKREIDKKTKKEAA